MEKNNIDFNKTVKLFLYGTWYRAYDNDAKIVSFITDYKLFEDPRTERLSIGFPENSIYNVTYLLKKNKINFLIKGESSKFFDFKLENNYDMFLHNDIPISYVKESIDSSKKPKGEIVVKYLDDKDELLLIIGDNIDSDAKLIREVLEHNENDLININGEEVIIIKKNIYF
ncbi:MAG: hypothetical protein PHN42_04650 [Bacilli bacterium]|nr:hypothetical protein [Bacilli bacterium]